MIRAAAAELPGPIGLADALEVCLALRELEPGVFGSAGARWVGRLIVERRLGIADAQLAMSAIAALADGEARAGAEALICLCERYELSDAGRALERWLAREHLDG
jgi:hypothetical protein